MITIKKKTIREQIILLDQNFETMHLQRLCNLKDSPSRHYMQPPFACWYSLQKPRQPV